MFRFQQKQFVERIFLLTSPLSYFKTSFRNSEKFVSKDLIPIFERVQLRIACGLSSIKTRIIPSPFCSYTFHRRIFCYREAIVTLDLTEPLYLVFQKFKSNPEILPFSEFMSHGLQDGSPRTSEKKGQSCAWATSTRKGQIQDPTLTFSHLKPCL